MFEKNTIARPYARALFEIAQKDSQLSEWSEMLNVAAMIAKDPQMVSVLKHPRFSNQDAVDLVLAIGGECFSQKFKHGLQFIGEKGRIGFLPEIFELFESYKQKAEKIVDVTIVSAFPLTVMVSEKVSEALKKRLNSNVSLNFETDKAIIGGAIIKAGDLVIDGSVRGKLTQLSDALGV